MSRGQIQGVLRKQDLEGGAGPRGKLGGRGVRHVTLPPSEHAGRVCLVSRLEARSSLTPREGPLNLLPLESGGGGGVVSGGAPGGGLLFFTVENGPPQREVDRGRGQAQRCRSGVR